VSAAPAAETPTPPAAAIAAREPVTPDRTPPATLPRLREPIRVGAASDSFPYSFVDERGQLGGFAVDVLDAAARAMNLKIERTILPAKEIQERFRQGEFDMLQSYGEAPDRLQFADFAVPYLNVRGAVFVRERNNPVHQLDDLQGRPFAILDVSSAAQDFLRDHGLNVRLIRTGSITESLRLVQNGEADGTFASRLTVSSIIERERFNNLTQLPTEATGIDLRHCFAVHKSDAVLLARLNEGLATLHRTGEFDRIYQKWFGRFDPRMFTSQEILKWAAGAFGLAFLVALWGFFRQRALGQRIARQAGELAENAEVLRALYENVPVAMCIIEAAKDGHRLITLNPRAGQFLGLSPEAAAGRRLDQLTLPPDWSTVLADLLRRWPADQKIIQAEHVFTVPRRTVLLMLVPLAPGANRVGRVCILTEDISERRRFDEELAQTRKLRAVGELVGGIAHEFNNLLTPIMLKASELQADRAHDGKLQQDVSVIARAVQRAAELTRRLLTFGRKTEMRSESVGLATIVVGAFDLLRPTMDRRIVWENAVPTSLPPLYFNSTDLNQILVNLLLNARDTIEDKLGSEPAPTDWTPCVRVEAVNLPPETAALSRRHQTDRPLIGWQRLTVRDSGMGITAEARERIFEPFYTTKPVGRGTGLGLATVWHLATQAGGTVEVESTPGEGSAFHVLLPVWPAPKVIPKSSPLNGSSAVNVGRILVVEDEELVALTMVAALKRHGHHIHHVTDGVAAWDHLAQNPSAYDLLILDVNLPGIDGIEFTRRARALNYPGRILVSSGRLTAYQLQALGQLQVDRLLPKPFNLDEFQAAVRDCLNPRKTAEALVT
jgi:two-component system, cell cycle sensor histidine kinase and response regulator CckA